MGRGESREGPFLPSPLALALAVEPAEAPVALPVLLSGVGTRGAMRGFLRSCLPLSSELFSWSLKNDVTNQSTFTTEKFNKANKKWPKSLTRE